MAYNKAILIGRICADPELRTTQSGNYVVSFSLAVDRQSKDKITDFIRVTAWRQTAEFISKYFSKGSAIGVEGSIQTRSYEDRNGQKREAVEVVADRAFFVESKKASADVDRQDQFETADEDGDLPF